MPFDENEDIFPVVRGHQEIIYDGQVPTEGGGILKWRMMIKKALVIIYY